YEMIYHLLCLLALSTSAFAQVCGGDVALGCFDDTDCTHGAARSCTRNAAATVPPGCCRAATTTTTTTTTARPTVAPITRAPSTPCVDLLNPQTGVSDCPARAYLCNNSVYLQLMRQQCPRTCGYCSNPTIPTNPNGCVDLTNPATGVSDCPARRAYCTNAIYLSLMRVQCRATCGFC
ncbi:hypothetical protein PENTCL1PPCAC_10211, partial [Pristionchus entomophagus]